ncbi:AAA family ATPase [Candidatus Bandiella euplotis]|uniref:AAA family ATPase n=1 Tax=Candidatus Bandiella euplotis TaxID=1664265 RepID=UPI002B259477|nr:AAA family ATPase [Candidatus Bandiella woodruffii]
MHLYLCIPLILPFLTYLLLLHFLHSVFIFLFSLLLAIFILASYLSYGNTPKNSLRFLSELLEKHYGQRVYILVDEYDNPLNHLLEKSLYTQNESLMEQTAELITGILAACGKGNRALEKIVLIGIFDPLKKEGYSGFNNIIPSSIMESKYSKHFGFSEAEVGEMITKLGFTEAEKMTVRENIKAWYDGYSVPVGFGEKLHVYTPWAVVNYMSNAYNAGEFSPKCYWAESGVATILSNILEKNIVQSVSQR